MTIKWDDYGESSLTLLAVHCGIEKEDIAIPYDTSDFARCIHLFECLNFGKGEILNLLAITSGKYPIWKPFADNWDELTELFNDDKQDFGRKCKCYAKLYEIRKTTN